MSQRSRFGRLFVRWSLFIMITFLAVLTTIGLGRSGKVADSVYIRSPIPESSGDIVYWSIRSNFAHITFDTLIYPATPRPRWGWIGFKRERPDPWIDEKLNIPYLWILAAECLLLLFLVPTVISSFRSK